MSCEPIDRFDGDYAYLSNFYTSYLLYEGIVYPSVEHAYQAAKTLDLVLRKEISDFLSPGQAKRVGQRLVIREDWEEVKLRVMGRLLLTKFRPSSMVAWKLELTGERELIEGNHWGDTFWGVCKGEGRNELGKLLMAVRRKNHLHFKDR